jgi:hypothetical protein
MVELASRIKSKLDEVAPALERERSKSEWTVLVHSAIAELAPEYAESRGIICGEVSGKHGATEVLTVYGKPAGTESGFMIDHCWLTWCDAPNDEKFGYLIRCDLAMETEWHNYDTERRESEALHHDFRKLVVTNDATKEFIFVDTGHVGDDTVEKFETQAKCFDHRSEKADYLVSFYLDRKFHHTLFST